MTVFFFLALLIGIAGMFMLSISLNSFEQKLSRLSNMMEERYGEKNREPEGKQSRAEENK